MATQYDVFSAHVNGSGFAYIGRTRIKGLIISGQASAGTVDIFDTNTVPTNATYGQTGNTITVTSTAHGLQTGDRIGIAFQAAGGNSATDNNYTVTVVDANTFTLTSINTASIATNTACTYSTTNQPSQWVTSMDTSAVTAGGQTLFLTIPGEGMVVHQGIYIAVTNINSVTLFLG